MSDTMNTAINKTFCFAMLMDYQRKVLTGCISKRTFLKIVEKFKPKGSADYDFIVAKIATMK